MSHAESTADHVLERLGIYNPDDLLLLNEIVYERGLIIRECPMVGSEARLLCGLGKPIISVSSSPTINPQRRRFSIAHELGHFELHRGKNLIHNCTPRDIHESQSNSTTNDEIEANQFASAFLIPARFVERPFSEKEPSFTLISEWAKRLDTSLTSTALRFTSFTNEPVAVIYSEKGVIKYFQSSKEFNDLGVFPDVGNLVRINTGAKKLFDGYENLNQWQEVRAASWFREDRDTFDRNDTIQEWSIKMPTYEGVLSLIWVKDPLGLKNGW